MLGKNKITWRISTEIIAMMGNVHLTKNWWANQRCFKVKLLMVLWGLLQLAQRGSTPDSKKVWFDTTALCYMFHVLNIRPQVQACAITLRKICHGYLGPFSWGFENIQKRLMDISRDLNFITSIFPNIVKMDIRCYCQIKEIQADMRFLLQELTHEKYYDLDTINYG